ncbi:c-type cytochrome [Pleionea mediterranea]|uniref:Cytochrome c553 n=1 Tax=Pleionea mediterranea TaxID=523701 RepID=A0A316FXM4_9GAMM|nr:c-type cytochrome [Pleionea mediterranea]PWK52865.1 cytochrome c553 [Pleionea mediterranea]
MKKFAVLFAILGLASTATAEGDAVKGQQAATACAACHGADGNTPLAPNYPKLSGQRANYAEKQLHDFKSGERDNAVMAGQVANLSDEDMANIAAFYASLEPQFAAVPAKYIEQGERLYRAGDKATGIPACAACHGPKGRGLDSAAFAALGGQSPQYTIEQLKAFRDGTRANDANRMMRDIAAKLSDEQMEALAYYMVGLH